MPYDPTLYRGCAEHYVRGRPPYSRALAETLASELELDGRGRLLDVGCGPGTLALELAGLFADVVGLDPDPEMLAAARERAHAKGIAHVRWVQAPAEAIPELGLGTFRLVSFGQSFHWTERERVAAAVWDALEPGGALALIGHQVAGRPRPEGPGPPPIPHEALRAVIARHLGPKRRAGQGYARHTEAERHEAVLSRTRFGAPRTLYCPGRPDLVQDADGVLSNLLSTSYAAPHLFGERLPAFVADVRAELARHSESGLFWDWPGDTEILLAVRAH